MNFFSKVNRITKTKGFVLPLTLLVSSIILTITSGITVILTKELYFSKLSRESQVAYYAADVAMMCAIMIDDQYIDPETGIGIFPYNKGNVLNINTPATTISDTSINYMNSVIDKVNLSRQNKGAGSISLNEIKCATSHIFNTDPVFSGFTTTLFIHPNPAVVGGDKGVKSFFSMKMDLGDGSFRCANVIISKTSNYRQIIARGFAACSGSASPIERAIVNTTEAK